jgi:hypothetical protein
MRPVLTVWMLLLAGCPTAPALCSVCPPIEGHYEMFYQPYDGGTDLSADCATVMPPAGPPTIDITRSGAELHATINAIACHGQLADSADFTLTGTEDLGGDAGNLRQVSLRGYFVAATSGDAGAPAQLQAKWITHTELGAQACDAEQRCTGTKK